MKNKYQVILLAASIAANVILLVATIAGLSGRRVYRDKYESLLDDFLAAQPETNAVDRTEIRNPEPTSAQSAPTLDAAAVADAMAKTNLPPVMSVVDVSYDGATEIDITLSERPDMEAIRRYVEVSPVTEGVIGFRYEAKYVYRLGTYEPRLIVTGDFAYGTNLTLVIRKGLPLYGKAADSDGALAEDWTATYRRKDAKPYVRLVSRGRYLPPGGRRSIAVEAMNVTNVYAEIRRVDPRNIVQLLAREEGVYDNYWTRRDGADGEDTGELAGTAETNLLHCAGGRNVKQIMALPISMKDGGTPCGVYLAAVRSADRERADGNWWWDDDDERVNPNRYRLVCVSDIGLSVRVSGDDRREVGVWATSLTTGAPIAGARVEVRSSANITLAHGVTDGNGWCAARCQDKGEAFAVIVSSPKGDDITFLAIENSMKVDETRSDGMRPEYLGAKECEAFVWTERGIYRHDERIMLHAILRDGRGRAPSPFPVEAVLVSPTGDERVREKLMPDTDGAVACEKFSVPADQPSGKWRLVLRTPGGKGAVLGECEIKVEEFAPPQIRVAVKAPDDVAPQSFSFEVSAEHLYGGPARALGVEGAVVFEDVPFAPEAWKGFHFGNDDLGIRPSFRRIPRAVLDNDGCHVFQAPLWEDSGKPKAAVRATGQGTVFEDGGRPATSRASAILHYYPFYIGTTLPSWLRIPEEGFPRISIVCVTPGGKALDAPRTLTMKLERIDNVYSYRKTDDGWHTWDVTRVRSTVAEAIEIKTVKDGPSEVAVPVRESGDYALTIEDAETGASFGRTFYLSSWGDDAIRAPLSDPTKVAIVTDKAFHRPGDVPRLIVKSPFTGHALLSVFREKEIYSEVVALTNATSEIRLRPAEASWAPNVEVTLSAVHGIAPGANHLAARAHGQTTVVVRRPENEIDVSLEAEVLFPTSGEGGAKVDVSVAASGVGNDAPTVSNAYAVVTVVDEGINILTGMKTPDPLGHFARVRAAEHPLYDLYHRLLPVLGDDLEKSGVRIGGGFGAEMLGRVSPVPTRRFKPLSMWKAKVPLENGSAKTTFQLPEFVGEVRVTAVAYTDSATGSKSVQRKVAPRLVAQPDAPRFVAPGDEFEVTLPLANRSGADGEVTYVVKASGAISMQRAAATITLAKDASTNILLRAKADRAGQGVISFLAGGFGERHSQTIELPVRPAAPWRAEAGVMRLEPGETAKFPSEGASKRVITLSGSPMGELVAALDWLADYPHGCLEQTSSRIFPLIAAGGVLNAVGGKSATNRAEYVAAGVRRVASMVRVNDFSMWPDCNYAPWDPDVSLYAAHFLVEADRAGIKPPEVAKRRVMDFLAKWAVSTNAAVSAYACHSLALAGKPNEDRMFFLYDRRDSLSPVARARLARAFALVSDQKRARRLLEQSPAPTSIKEAAFLLLAMLDTDPGDARALPLVRYLEDNRDKARYCWGTTGDNAHALLALAAYYQHNPVKTGNPKVEVLGAGRDIALADRESCIVNDRDDGSRFSPEMANNGDATAFVSWSALMLPDPASATNEESCISVSRRYFTPEGKEADLGDLRCGDMLVAEITVRSVDSRQYADLVVEDLFAGAFEPVLSALDPTQFAWCKVNARDWVMRNDARDDRMLVFSKRFHLEKDGEVVFHYPLRVVSAGEFVLPGPAVEAMYAPEIRARGAASRITVRH